PATAGGVAYTWTRGATSGTGTWTPGQPLAIGEFALQLTGVPAENDQILVMATKPADVGSNNGNARALAALRDAAIVDGQTITDAYASAMAGVGVRVQGARTAAEISASVAASAEQQRAAKSGVNLDEEAARLIQFQQAYQAAAKVLQVAQSVFGALTGRQQTTGARMRVTTAYTFNASVDSLQRRQQDLVERQLQLTSGKRVQRASDDPTAAARAERALAAVTRTEAEQRAIEASRNVMTLAESALGDAGEGLRTQLFAIANRSDGAGTYLFAGQGGGVEPFADQPGGVAYQGLRGDFSTAAREPLPLSVDGEAAWLGGPGGGVFATLDRAIRDLDPPAGHVPPPREQVTRDGLEGIDGAMNTMQRLRARIGELLNRADLAEGRVADERLYHQSERSNAEDLDMVQAISAFQNQQTGYDAALKAYSIVQRMSLFQYLNG
ncbi:MAG: hypothetical protein MUE62_10700, partial [Burkholderiaceae bacterium]|nr:hypothetical protein [Burkholderiaceae bacterium]